MTLYLCSSGSNARGELRALERAPCQLKKPFKGSETETRELLGGTEEKSLSSTMIFNKKETGKIELVARPVGRLK